MQTVTVGSEACDLVAQKATSRFPSLEATAVVLIGLR